MGIASSDISQDSKLQLCVVAADAAVKQYCKNQFENSIYTEFPFRLGGEAIVLTQTPVLSYRLAGNIANGQPTIAGLSSTSNLLVGMPVLQGASRNVKLSIQPFPNGVTIESIDSTSQVTLTGNATQTATGVPFIFGLAVWFDPQGAFGDGIGSGPDGPFGSTSLLYAGLDYALQRDGYDGNSSKSGKLTRLASVLSCFGMSGDWGMFGSEWGGFGSRGTLSANLPPLWPKYPAGCVRVIYAAGIGQGALAPDGSLPLLNTIPADLTMAVNGLAAWCWRNANSGLLQTQSSSFQGYSVSVAMAVDALKSEGPLGDVRRLLSRYRKVSI